jgi:SET domain-containing protein
MTHLYDLKGSRHLLHDYVFGWYGKAAIGLGCGSIYNHSNDNANASHRMNDDVPGIEFVAKRDIQPGEEILIHYWKGRIRGEFTDSGTMIADGRITEDMKAMGIAKYRKKKRR